MSSHTLTIWIVDDDDDDLYLISEVFRQSHPHLTIETLKDGAEVLAKLRVLETLPRLILLDINMPRMNGLQTLRELRAEPHFAALPVIMLTTAPSDPYRQQALALGANLFFTKPSTIQEFSGLINELDRRWLSA